VWQAINQLITMLLGGLWHGSSWLFMIWGGLNGLGILVHKFWSKISPFKNSNNLAVKFFLMLVTLTFISFTRIFFRSDNLDTVNTIFYRINNHFGDDLFFKILQGYKFVLIVLLFGYLIHWIPERIKIVYRNWFASLPLVVMGLIVVFAVFLMFQLMSGEMQPFIYFQL
jgi:D-alanyl-lipoteichoic acid acyltransferase DltB (MBOAT superfamily)